MIIVSGRLYVDEVDRDRCLHGCRPVIVAARDADGCVVRIRVAGSGVEVGLPSV